MFKILLVLYNFASSSTYSNFKDITDIQSIKAFAKDISMLTSSAMTYSARNIGFNGFSFDFRTSYQDKPSKNDTVIKKDKPFNLNFIQAGIGFPYRFDIFLRAGGNDGYNIIGGGLRYGLKNITDKTGGINISITIYSHMGLYKYFYLTSWGSQISFSTKLSRIIYPFISTGYDRANFHIECHPTFSNENFYITLYRGVAGIRFRFNLLNIAFAYEYSNTSRNVLSTVAGIRF